MKKPTTAQQKSIYETMEADLATSSKSSRPNFLLSKTDVQKLDIIGLVYHCLETKKLVSFAVARVVALNTPEIADRFSEKGFRQADSSLLIKAFATILEGADALLTNEQGAYASDVLATRHGAWRKKNGINHPVLVKAKTAAVAVA